MFGRTLTPPALMRLTYCGNRLTPCPSEPCRSAAAIRPATVAASASGKPTATPPILLVDRYDQYDPDTGEFPTKRDAKLTATWTTAGALELAGKTTGLDKATAADLVGTHTLTFP